MRLHFSCVLSLSTGLLCDWWPWQVAFLVTLSASEQDDYWVTWCRFKVRTCIRSCHHFPYGGKILSRPRWTALDHLCSISGRTYLDVNIDHHLSSPFEHLQVSRYFADSNGDYQNSSFSLTDTSLPHFYCNYSHISVWGRTLTFLFKVNEHK